ncbi:hypothetical protein [Spiroplasma tabanidicola]|uniref:Uncharacterized protein n=1 Tax=Spiroplasma tabanidicola TaxID=324079 RepID=A0A6I6C7I5_9MOLU|nr:hypothetical protein [Spiroplasma tabanidicola]QGS52180.1 hypothetical protein STABA_v1c08250 [Spiroplasma tabanidicola]
MKQKRIYLLFLCLFFIFIVNFGICVAYYIKNINPKIESKIEKKLNYNKNWPDETDEYLSTWQSMHTQSAQELNDISQKIKSDYLKNYTKLLYYYKDNPYSCNQNCDNRGIPNFEIEKIYKEVCDSDDIQMFGAQTLKSLYIESRINKIKKTGSSLIDSNSFIILWALKYFNAITYYDSVREWNSNLWEIVGFALDINFYTFGNYVQDGDWTKGPSEEDLANYPADVKVEANSVMKSFIDDLYDYVFIEKHN